MPNSSTQENTAPSAEELAAKSKATLPGNRPTGTPALTPWPDPVSGAELLAELRAELNRFMARLAGDVILAAWLIHTYLLDCFTYTPYVNVTSPERECGKSTLAELLGLLAHNACTPGGMTAPAMFRRIERDKPTLLLDEWDTLRQESRDACLNVLNTGFKCNGVYTICVGDNHEPKDFHTFCPKAIFGLAGTRLPDTTRSRCLSLVLHRKQRGDKVEKFRAKKFEARALELRRKMLRWANDNRETLKCYEPAMPESWGPRQQDISEPLLAVADQCGGEWQELTRAALTKLFTVSAEPGESSSGTELLRDLRLILKDVDQIGSKEACDLLNGMATRPWTNWNTLYGINQRDLAKQLKPYGVSTRDIWQDGKSVKGYCRGDLEEAFLTYLPPETERESARQPENIGPNANRPSARASEPRASENLVSPSNDAGSRGLADEKQQNGGAA
jgi:hypothetical protein